MNNDTKGEISKDPSRYAPYLTLLRCPRMGAVRLRRLLDRFGTPEKVLSASHHDLLQVERMNAEAADAIIQAGKGEFDRQVQKEISWLRGQGVRLVLLDDPAYPTLLKEIASPPPVLYIWGTYRPEDVLTVGIVGSRQASDYGRRCASEIACALAERGLTIASGMATGIDTAAHKGALRAGGRTLAVLGNGIKICYPKHNEELARQIRRSGALLSEFPYDTAPQSRNFPPRNRVISGLSLGVIIVEAGERSGALHTARFALDQNREVFAIPGKVTSDTSQGTNALIRDAGAKLVTNPEDILCELEDQIEVHRRNLALGPQETVPAKREYTPASLPNLSPEERKVFDALSDEPVHIDDLSRRLSIPTAQLSSLLAMMELRGIVERTAGTRFRQSS
ncbi:MAG: DNA-processing protein DprA [bacterium]